MSARPQKPKLLYQAIIERKPFMRRFVRSLIIAVASALALVAFGIAIDRGLVDSALRTPGIVITGLATLLFGLRALINLVRGLRRQNETLRIFDRGIVLTRAGKDTRYLWSALRTFREGGGGLYLGKRPLIQWGGHMLKMRDGKVLKLTGLYGDLRTLARAIRGPAAHVTGMDIGKALREEKPVKLNRQLTVWPGGVQVGRQEIPWSELDVRLQNNRLAIYRAGKDGKFRPVKRFSLKSLNNAGGFMEVATATIRNHQRARFGTKDYSIQA